MRKDNRSSNRYCKKYLLLGRYLNLFCKIKQKYNLSKRQYSSKANSSNIHYFSLPRGTVRVAWLGQDISIGYLLVKFHIPRLLGQARVWSRSPRRIRKCRERTYRYSALTNPVIRVMDMGTAGQGTPNHPAGLGSSFC